MAATMVATTSQVQTQAMANTMNFSSFNRPGYRFKAPIRVEEILVGEGPGRRLRKNVANVRRHVDYVPCVLNHVKSRVSQLGRQDRIAAQPDELYQNSALPPAALTDKPIDCVLTKFVRAAMNKVKCPVYTLTWTPEGKRMITGASTGEFTLWNGTAFNFETILQAHDVAVRAMTWAHNGNWLVSGDADGFVKYWQPNMNNVHMFHAHKDDAVRGLRFASTDLKFASGSDDGTAKVWDFARYTEEFTLRGHGSEVRCLDWHPSSSLICTGSRDTQQPVKLWDAVSGKCVITLQHHKSSVMAVEFNQNGNWLLTASRDQLIKMYDIRTMKVMKNFRGHKKEVTAVAWHPVHEALFATGGGDGSIAYWLVDNQKEIALLEHAHDQAIWCMRWHPLGHILATGSNDNNTKFWARNRPGDTQEDIFGLASFTSNMLGAADHKEAKTMYKDKEKDSAVSVIPGMGLDEEVYESMNRDVGTVGSSILQLPEDLNSTKQQGSNIGAKRTLIKQPPPKRAQRQFERMWNVAKPGAGEDDFDEAMAEIDQYAKREKASLLGPPPTASMLGGGSSQITSVPPPSKPPSMLVPPRYNTRSGLLRTPGGAAASAQQTSPTSGGVTTASGGSSQYAPPPASSPPPPTARGSLLSSQDTGAPPSSGTLANAAATSANAVPLQAGRSFGPPPPGMWPPGIPMPPHIAALQQKAQQQQQIQMPQPIVIKQEIMDEDVDYRTQDEDFRAPPQMPPAATVPSQPSYYDKAPPAASLPPSAPRGGYESSRNGNGYSSQQRSQHDDFNSLPPGRATTKDYGLPPASTSTGNMPPMPPFGAPGDVDARIPMPPNVSLAPPSDNRARMPPQQQAVAPTSGALPPTPPNWPPNLPPPPFGLPPPPFGLPPPPIAGKGYAPVSNVAQGHTASSMSGGAGYSHQASGGGASASAGGSGASRGSYGSAGYSNGSNQANYGGYQQQHDASQGAGSGSQNGGRGGYQSGGSGQMRGRGRGRGYGNRPY